MKNYRFYFYTIISFLVFSVLVSTIAIPYLLKLNGSLFLENQIESAQQQVHPITIMNSEIFKKEIKDSGNYKNEIEKEAIELENARKKDSILMGIQNMIENTDKQNIFISILNWSGEILSYPDKTRIGENAEEEGSKARGIEKTTTGIELYEYIYSLDKSTLNTKKSEIIYIESIVDSGWIVAGHINISNTMDHMNEWKNQTYLVFLIIMLVLLLLVLGIIRMMSGYYENQLELKNSRLEDGVLNLSKLNTSLENYQSKLTEIAAIKEKEPDVQQQVQATELPKENEKQRILTYVRNELMPISTEDIAYIYVENTITYVVRKDGKRSTTSESLDQVYSYLSEKSFFRANRQIIVAISAIDKITKFGNSKLKIQVNPTSEIDIIIGKNKAAAFKQWLDL